jgi:ATP-binding cassette subfamily C protein LapB
MLVLFCKVYHHPYSAESITAGLPIDPTGNEQLFSLNKAKGMFSRVADRAGLTTTVIERSLDKISPLQLPMILLLKDQQNCILDSFSADKKQVKIIISTEEPSEQWVDIDILASQYLGFSFLVKKKFNYEKNTHNALKAKESHWFWSSISYSKKLYQDAFIASFLINIFVLATPLFTMNVYDRVIPNNAMETLFFFAIGVLLVYILDTFLKFTRTGLLEAAAKKSDVIISSRIFEKVLALKMTDLPRSVGSFASNIKDFDSIRSFLTNATLTSLIDLPFAILFLGVIFYIAGIIVLVPLSIMLLILCFALLKRKALYQQIASSHQASAQKNAILIESLQNIETIKTQGKQGYTQWLWEEASGEIAQQGLKTRIMTTSLSTITSFFVQLNTIFVILVGVYLIQGLELTMGGLIATMILSSRCVAPMGQTAALIGSYQDAKTSFSVLDELMNKPTEHADAKDVIQLSDMQGKIEFRDVTFTYPGSELPALKNVSFIVPAGQRTAIIGRIGSGKSTVEKLILKLYQADSGHIFIDDIDIRQLEPTLLRKNIGYVPQDIHLFKGTLKENIVGSAYQADDQQLLKVAKLAGVTEFVQRHAKGYQMEIEERGGGLSGGQRQCVGIARALYHSPTIMLLDEPTSNMDQTSEVELLLNLRTELTDKSTLLITHKLNLLELVNHVIVLKNGQVYLNGDKDKVINQLATTKTSNV